MTLLKHNNPFTLPFAKIRSTDVMLVGGKGASLGEMTAAGIPVPPGFVVTSHAFYRFLDETDLTQEVLARIEETKFDAIDQVEKTSETLRALIENASMPEDIAKEIMEAYAQLSSRARLRNFLVAVRSSATAEDSKVASWAGELETYLNTIESALLPNVQRCWSSVFTPRALMYGCEKGVWQGSREQGAGSNWKRGVTTTRQRATSYKLQVTTCPVAVAVVVQQMVQSEIAGVAFTVHPVTEDRNHIIMEAGWGLGEAVVSGQVTPDSYVVDKRDWSIVDITVNEQDRRIEGAGNSPSPRLRRAGKEKGAEGRQGANRWVDVSRADRAKQKLSGKEIIELSQLCKRIEDHYGFPCDIEWAMIRSQKSEVGGWKVDGGAFYITQSRPITTLKK